MAAIRCRQATTEKVTAKRSPRSFGCTASPQQKSRTRGKTITATSTALAVAYVLFVVVLTILGVDIRELVGPVTLLPGSGLILAGLLAGFLTDYFQPTDSLGLR
ncbi:hypothetical protein ABIB29_003346 [Arthrobacter sp. UYEF36]